MRDFDNKRAFITGGSSGIGLALARQLVQAGAHVAIAARGVDQLEQAREHLQELSRGGRKVLAYPLDIADKEAVAALAPRVLEELGGVDLLVNNAGIARPGHFMELPDSLFEEMVAINYLGAVWVTRAFLPGMMQRRSGHVLNVSSIAGVMGVFGYTAYAGSKFALAGFTECLRQELEPSGVGVTLLCPPDTDTPQLAGEEAYKPPETKALAGSVKAMSAEAVAAAALAGVRRGAVQVVPGLDGTFTTWAWRHAPWLVRRIIRGKVAGARGRQPSG
jgi:3-dehydrosphinganine reductase